MRKAVVLALCLIIVFSGCVQFNAGDNDTLNNEEKNPEPESKSPEEKQSPEIGDVFQFEKQIKEDNKTRYIEENDTVTILSKYRYIYENGNRTGKEPVYDAIPFEDWAESKCPHSAGGELFKALNKSIEKPLGPIGISVGVEFPDSGNKYISVIYHRKVKDGEVVRKPEIEYDALKKLVPENAKGVIKIDGRKYNCKVDVKIGIRDDEKT